MYLLNAIALLALGSLAIPFLVAQTPAPTSPAPTQDAVVLHANANLVLLDVVVTERDKAVHGLNRSRIHVFEDGQEQTITAFDEHQPAATPAVAASPASLPPHTYSNAPTYPESSAVNVLLLDALNTPTANQVEVREQMLDYLAKIEPGTTLAIFTLASHLQLVAGFTADADQLGTTLKNPQITHASVAETDQQTVSDQLESAENAVTMRGGASTAAHLQEFATDLTAYQTDQRVLMTLDALQGMARYLSAIPGRKNLIWFSGSFPISLDPNDSRSPFRGSREGPFRGVSSYEDQVRVTSQLLSAARVAVYPVDARGLMSQPSFDANYAGPAGPGGSVSGNNNQFIQQTGAEEGSMRQIAEQTGGHVYVGTNGLKEAVAKAVENGASYYTIAYAPAAKPPDGKFHAIKLRVDNADYKLAYRHGYYADSADKPSAHNPGQSNLIMAATMHGAPPATQIVFQARVLKAADPLLQGAKLPDGPAGEMTATLKAPLQRYIVDTTIDAHTLNFADAPDGAHQSAVEFALIAYDADGRRLNYSGSSLRVSLKADQYTAVLARGIPIRIALDLPVGHASLCIAVHDLNAGSTGSLEVPLTVSMATTH